MTIRLPYPPSVNSYYRHVGSRVLISRHGRRYRDAVCGIVGGRIPKWFTRVRMTVDVHPPDRRRRDIDNILKALLDAIVHGGVIADDSLIKELHVRMLDPVAGGSVVVDMERCDG